MTWKGLVGGAEFEDDFSDGLGGGELAAWGVEVVWEEDGEAGWFEDDGGEIFRGVVKGDVFFGGVWGFDGEVVVV